CDSTAVPSRIPLDPLPRPPCPTLFPYTDALPIFARRGLEAEERESLRALILGALLGLLPIAVAPAHSRLLLIAQLGACTLIASRSEEHTSELQSRENLVCRLLLEKKNSQVRRVLS